MTRITKSWITALCTLLLISMLAVIALMLQPLYVWDTEEILMLHTLTVDGEETEYDQHSYLEFDAFIVPFLKGEKLEGADPSGKYNVYRWKIEPKNSTEFLILEPTDEWVNSKTQELGLTSVEDIVRFKSLTIVKRWGDK